MLDHASLKLKEKDFNLKLVYLIYMNLQNYRILFFLTK